jgi:hypothetical protein
LVPTQEDRDTIAIAVHGDRQTQADLEKLPGWAGYSESRKLYLELLPLFKYTTELSVYIGRHRQWGSREAQNSKIFKQAVTMRRTQNAGLLEGFTERLWLRAQMELADLLGHKDPRIRLQTIAMLAKMNGVFKAKPDKPDGGDLSGMEVNVPHSSANGKSQ